MLFLEGNYFSSEVKFWCCFLMCKYTLNRDSFTLEHKLFASCCLLNVIRCREASKIVENDVVDLFCNNNIPYRFPDSMKITSNNLLEICDESLHIFPSLCGKLQRVILLEDSRR